MTLRGHCPCCGNLQAVPNGISQHGYTVKHGWFEGVCPGYGKSAIEVDRAEADNTITQVLAECAELDAKADALRAGKITPNGITERRRINGKVENVFTAFADLPEYKQQGCIDNAVFAAEHRARQGRDFAAYLQAVIDKYHGQPLIEEEKKAPAAPIFAGQKKLSERGTVMTCSYVQGARVYYNNAKGWIGTQAWRKLQDA